MKDVLGAELQSFLKLLVPERDPLLMEMEKYALENHVSIVEQEVGQLLKLLVSITRPEKILEIGTAIGYSTICMAQALKDEAQITTIELLPGRYKIASANFQKAGVQDRIKIINGDAREIVPKLQEKFDFIFLDAAKGQYPEFFKLTPQILKSGGLLVFDNVLINGWVIDLKYPERRKKTMVYRMRNFLEELRNNKDFLSSIIPLGDGVLLCWKKGEENE